MMAADMQQRVEHRDGDHPRRLPAPELVERWGVLERKLVGMDLKGKLRCSNTLINLVAQMVEDNTLRYLQWAKCTERQLELDGEQLDRVWKPDANGFLREETVRAIAATDVSTDLLLKLMFQRRGLAGELGRAWTFLAHELLVNRLIGEYMSDPPSGCLPVSIDQLRQADKRIWELVIEKVSSTAQGLRINGDGTYPVDVALREALADPRVGLLLIHKPRGGGGGASVAGAKRQQPPQRAPSEAPQGTGRTAKKRQRRNQNATQAAAQIAELRSQLAAAQGKGAGGGGRGSAKGSGKAGGKPGVRMPRDLQGLRARDDHEQNICFDFNLAHGCQNAVEGGRCRRGRHCCCRCLGPHPAVPKTC